MGKKYIIELNPDCVEGEYLRIPARIAGKEQWLVTKAALTPCTELDLEQVRKEAYEKGYHDGHNVCYENAKDLMEEKKNEAYQRGLSDAWETARKIHHMPDGDILDLFPDCYVSVCTAAQAILKYDASEAIAKIKGYEDGKQEYRVGDEFENGVGQKFIVLKMDGKEIDRYIDGDGKTYVMKEKYRVMRKTGRHFPEIATVLEKMRGEQE